MRPISARRSLVLTPCPPSPRCGEGELGTALSSPLSAYAERGTGGEDGSARHARERRICCFHRCGEGELGTALSSPLSAYAERGTGGEDRVCGEGDRG